MTSISLADLRKPFKRAGNHELFDLANTRSLDSYPIFVQEWFKKPRNAFEIFKSTEWKVFFEKWREDNEADAQELGNRTKAQQNEDQSFGALAEFLYCDSEVSSYFSINEDDYTDVKSEREDKIIEIKTVKDFSSDADPLSSQKASVQKMLDKLSGPNTRIKNLDPIFLNHDEIHIWEVNRNSGEIKFWSILCRDKFKI